MASDKARMDCVWITGGSSGIGRELAIRYARAGARVAASARSVADLEALAAAHPGIMAYPLDVTDRAAVVATVRRIEADHGPIDLAVLSAGVFTPMSVGRFSAETLERTMTINYGGICNALDALVPAMTERGAGHITMVSSVAGLAGLPKLAPYSASKAAVNALADSLATELAAKGVTLSLVTPGYIETPMTDGNSLPMPFLVSLQEAADAIERGIARRRYSISFPWQMALLMRLYRRAPYSLYFWIARNFLTPPSRRPATLPPTADIAQPPASTTPTGDPA